MQSIKKIMEDSNMNKDTQRCLDWIKTKYDISTLSVRSIIEIVLDWGRDDALKNAAKVFEWRKEQEEKKKIEENSREDFREEQDSEGRIWYIRTHNYKQRKESRKLDVGDIIKFENDNGCGVMIIGSFDYESDFAPRSYYHIYAYKSYDDNGKEKISVFNGGMSCPGITRFTKATDEETAVFFKQIEDCYVEDLYFYFRNECKFMPDVVKERYSKYYKEL